MEAKLLLDSPGRFWGITCVSDWGIGVPPLPVGLLCMCGDQLLSWKNYKEQVEEGMDKMTLHGGST